MKSVRIEGSIVAFTEPIKISVRGIDRNVVEAEVEDETGRILLVLWDEKIQPLEVGDRIVVDKGFVTSFKGKWRINVGREGDIRKV